MSISVSDDLIMSAEETHATSLTRPSGFLLTWMEMFNNDDKDLFQMTDIRAHRRQSMMQFHANPPHEGSGI